MTLFKTDTPRAIDRVIDYFGESRRIFAGSSTPPPATSGKRPVAARGGTMGSRLFVLIATLGLLLAPAHSVRAADLMKHSGVIVDFDEKTDTIVVAEVGPWRVPDGATVITYQRIALTPETQFAIVFRTEGRMRFAGDFVESPLERAGVYVDDSVTVECRHERGRMIALKITVVDLPGGAFQKESGR